MQKVWEWLKSHKWVTGGVMTLGYSILYVMHGGDPGYDVAREMYIWLSGALVGAGLLPTDFSEKMRLRREDIGLPERRKPE